MNASYGRYLDVDLTTQRISEHTIPEHWQQRFLGGKGLAARLLLDLLPGPVDPLGPDNPLVFATGPLQGTRMVGGGRHAVVSVSPKSRRVADSYCGGYFGHELALTGYDGLLIRGSSPTPVFLSVIDGKARLHAADDLWGKGTGQTETTLREQFPGSRVSSIGVAGERRVVQACIMSDRSRAAGRPGLGAVMGSKRLKAIVLRGDQTKPLADAARFSREHAAYLSTFSDPATRRFGQYGTAGGVTTLSEMGILPTRNFQQGIFAHAEEIGGVRLHDTILVERETCVGCPIRCKRAVKTSFDGHEVEPIYGGPEYETLAALGSLCMNHDLSAIAWGNQLCNEYGLDTISAGVVVAFLMEASEKGLINETIPWGDAQGLIRQIHDLAHREGIAAHAADGLSLFAEQIGADFAACIKGVEIPMHEPRGKQGMGLSYATSPRGATHMEGLHDTMLSVDPPCPELGIDHTYDRFSLEDKVLPAKTFEDLRSFDNSLVVCCFTTRSVGERYNYPAIRSLVEAATGRTLDVEEMLRIGERGYAAMRLLSGLLGHTQDEDGLPARFAQPLPSGPSAYPVDPGTLRSTIRALYDARGYDRFGPTDATLRALDMDDCTGRLPRP